MSPNACTCADDLAPACMLSCSHVWLFSTPWIVAHQAPLSMGFSRQEYWSGLPCTPPGESSWPRNQTHVSYTFYIGLSLAPPGKLPSWRNMGPTQMRGKARTCGSLLRTCGQIVPQATITWDFWKLVWLAEEFSRRPESRQIEFRPESGPSTRGFPRRPA